MKTYIVRSLKYVLQLVVLFVIVFGLMTLFGTANHDSWGDVFLSQRGILLLASIVVLAALYPAFGFTKRDVRLDFDADREKLLNAFSMSGYRLDSQTPDQLTMRAESAAKRVMLVWEDAITVTRDGKYVVISGVRKEVVKVEYRLKTIMRGE